MTSPLHERPDRVIDWQPVTVLLAVWCVFECVLVWRATMLVLAFLDVQWPA